MIFTPSWILWQEWPHDKYPPWAHGPGYIIARDIAKFIVQGHQKRDLKVINPLHTQIETTDFYTVLSFAGLTGCFTSAQ